MSFVRVLLTLALNVSLIAIASPSTAQSFAQLNDRAVKPVSVTGGGVLSNGNIVAGNGFTIEHPQKGDYVVHFKSGLFAGLPMFSCTPIGESVSPPVCIAATIVWTNGSGPSSVEFKFFTSDTHQPVNSGFMFTEFTTKTTN